MTRRSRGSATHRQAIVTSIQGGGKVLLCGNGGSAAEAEHLAAELIGRFCMERALAGDRGGNNVAALTAIANDYDYEDASRGRSWRWAAPATW